MRLTPVVVAAALAMSSAASAGPTVGLGLSFSFGSGTVDTGVGIRVFSNNKRNRAVGSVGLDYMFGSQSMRGTIGAGYLTRNLYGGLDLGFDFGTGDFNFGPSLGVTRSTRRAAPPPPAAAPPSGLE
jgi:hypothetical protein